MSAMHGFGNLGIGVRGQGRFHVVLKLLKGFIRVLIMSGDGLGLGA